MARVKKLEGQVLYPPPKKLEGQVLYPPPKKLEGQVLYPPPKIEAGVAGPIPPGATLNPQPTTPTKSKSKEMKIPTTWQVGASDDPIWEKIFGEWNEEHRAKYGIPMNRPWDSDADSQRTYAVLSERYKEEWEKQNPTDTDGITVAGGGDGGESSWSGYEQNVADLYERGRADIEAGRADIRTMLDAYGNPIGQEVYNLAREQIEYASRRLTEIEEARKLTDMTGTLTSDEKRMFQEMEDSAVANLKSQVNAQTQDVWNTSLSDLVNRGVLQGTVGQKILGTISSENVRTIAEGSNLIRGQTNANMLAVQEASKNRAMTWQNMLTGESLALMGMGQGYANADLQAQMQELGIGVGASTQLTGQATGLTGQAMGANVNFAGFASNEEIQAQNRALQGYIANLNAETQWKLGMLSSQTQLGMASMYQGAANQASQYGMYGNLGVVAAAGLTKYLQSDTFGDWWKSYNANNSSYGDPSISYGDPSTVDPYDYGTGYGYT